MGEQLTLEEMHLNFSHSCLNPCTFNRIFLYFFWFNRAFMFMELVLMLSVLYNRCREIIFKDLLEAGSQVFLPLLTSGLYSTPTAHKPKKSETGLVLLLLLCTYLLYSQFRLTQQILWWFCLAGPLNSTITTLSLPLLKEKKGENMMKRAQWFR